MKQPDLGFVYRYASAQRPNLPTLLLLHGTGGDENDLLPLGQALLPGAALLSPRGRVLEHGMPRFFRRLAEGVFDFADLRFQTLELADFTGAAARSYGFDPANIMAVGYSNGANIAASMLLLRPEVLAGAVLFHGQVTLEPDQRPDLSAIPIFLSGGRADPLIPPSGTEHLAALLCDAGAEVTLHWEPDGHALGRGELLAARRWLAEHVQSGVA